jgi:hypothetical protein
VVGKVYIWRLEVKTWGLAHEAENIFGVHRQNTFSFSYTNMIFISEAKAVISEARCTFGLPNSYS